MKRKDEEYLVQELLRSQLSRGQINRRQFLQNMLMAGLGFSGISALSACGAAPATEAPAAATEAAAPAAATQEAAAAATGTRPLTPTFYDWIMNLHPSIPKVNEGFKDLDAQIAPVQGFGIERFLAEGKNKESTWDVYVGMTPFVEMSSFIEADVIEPWDNYIPKEVIDDLIPSIREECTVDGKLYSWPFFLDVCTMGWNSEMTDKAGITEVPTDWDAYLAASKQVVDSGAALYGCTFDSRGWRSVAPFTHSLSTDVYTAEGLFDFTSDPAIEALKLMKEMMALSHPDILLEGATDGGVNQTPDEVAFGAQKVAYYCKYQNAPLRFAANWPDPSKLGLAALPKFKNGVGSTVFWTTGCCLFKYGQNKEKAAEYVKTLTYDPRIWKDSIAGSETAHPGQLPPYKSIYADWDANKPDWMPDFVKLVRTQLDVAKAIDNHVFALTQFVIGKPLWEKFLTGEEPDPKVAMQSVVDAVKAEMAKAAK